MYSKSDSQEQPVVQRSNLWGWLPRRRKSAGVFAAGMATPLLFILLMVFLLPAPLGTIKSTATDRGKEKRGKPVGTQSSPAADRQKGGKAQKTHYQLLKERANLEIKQAYFQSSLKLAATDSIYLSLDLADSTIAVDIKGVTVRICRISKIKMAADLNSKRESSTLIKWLSSPFSLQSETSTISEAPIRVKRAPADTVEAMAMAEVEIPREKRFVCFTLDFDRNLSVTVAEEKAENIVGWARKVFQQGVWESKSFLSRLGERLGCAERGNAHIYLEISRMDAKAVYRALPARAGLAFRPSLFD